ncbi:MAG TPA: BrnA antitoxin family protein [Acetobacteraceae bacterium]|nr:BrnA antitoxin family protein [Acetobacteraceae bacterium]
MGKRNDDRASRPDDENPEWTREEIRRARPALEVVSEVFGPKATQALRRGRGRPEKPDRKVNQTLRLDPDVLEAYRHQGSGWKTRINEVLRQHMPKPGK